MKTAIVTGASSGFGKQICIDLLKNISEIKVVALARRSDKLEILSDLCSSDRLLTIPVDLRDFSAVDSVLSSLPEGFREIDLLVNNAGLAKGLDRSDECDFEDWRLMVDTNINSVIFITHKVLPGMVSKGSGTIINMGSVAGTYPYLGSNVYGATKAFLRQFSLNLRADLIGRGVRVALIEPGICSGTEFSVVRFEDEDRAEALYRGVKCISPEDISRTVLWIYSMPAHFNVNRIELMPVNQAATGIEVVRDG